MAAMRFLLPWQRVRVSGHSMTPTLLDGNLVLVRYRARVAPGQVVLARFRSRPELAVLKRVDRAADDGWLLVSDNRRAGSDSRQYGVADVLAGAVWMWPSGPAGAAAAGWGCSSDTASPRLRPPGCDRRPAPVARRWWSYSLAGRTRLSRSPSPCQTRCSGSPPVATTLSTGSPSRARRERVRADRPACQGSRDGHDLPADDRRTATRRELRHDAYDFDPDSPVFTSHSAASSCVTSTMALH